LNTSDAKLKSKTLARRRRGFRRSRKPVKSIKIPKIKFSDASKRYFTILFTMMFVGFGSIILSMMVVQEIVPNSGQQLYTRPASFSMFLVSFIISMIAWQGIGILNVLLWVIGKVITFGLDNSAPPTTRLLPPNAWKMIPYSMAICGIYGMVIGLANSEVETLITTFDFAIAGGAWGVFLNMLARFRLLPIDENAIRNFEEDLK